MSTINKILDKPQFYADIPLLMLMGGVMNGVIASRFRFVSDWYFVYPYGMILSMIIILVSQVLALCALITLIRSALSGKKKPDIVSLLLILFPLVYVSISLAYDN